MNIVKMRKNAKLKDIIDNPKNHKTMLTKWFTANREHIEARELTYCEFPLKWRWEEKNKKMDKKTTWL